MAPRFNAGIGVTAILATLSMQGCLTLGQANAIAPVSRQLPISDLQQADYHLPSREMPVTDVLTHSEFSEMDSTPWGAVVIMADEDAEGTELPPLLYQDINGDNFEDVLVPLLILPESEGEAYQFGLATVLHQNGTPEHISTYVTEGYIFELSLEDNQVIAYGETDPYREENKFTYTWQADGLTLVHQEEISLETPLPNDHDQYRALDLDRIANRLPLVTTDPAEFTLNLLGAQERFGRYQETVEIIGASNKQQVIAFTATGLQDDSVSAQRYRLEFVAEGDQWRLDWGGQQFSCGAGRGRQTWHPELCS